MSGRRLVLVDGPADAGPQDPATDVVALDPWWHPEAGDRGDIVSVTPVIRSILQRRNLVQESLSRLDTWATAAGLADAFMDDRHTWWFRVRMAVRWDLHELVLWRLVIGELASPGRYGTIVVPGDRVSLVAAARAYARTPGAPTVATSRATGAARPRLRALVVHLPARAHRVGRWCLSLRPAVHGRVRILDARLRALAARPPRVIAVAFAGAFQVVDADDGPRLLDPHLALVLDRVAAAGLPVATLATGVDHLRARDWPMIAQDDRLVPRSIVEDRWQRSEDDAIESSRVTRAVRAAAAVPIDLDGSDLGPAMAVAVERYAGRWLDRERRWARWAERFLAEIRPGALFIDREATRTAWIIAARRLGIPVVSVQHGMIFPDNPEFCYPLHRGVPRPDVTCVFGPYERDILVDQAGYRPAEVIVTGSPRADPEAFAAPGSPAERGAVRLELGIAPAAKVLVVSVAHNEIGERYSADMVARLLDGPLPGVHVVVKLHPQDRGSPGYARLLAGLARAGGHEPARLTVVRDIDLFRLLRAADAHLGQHSTVLTDAVVAGIPNMIAVGQAYADTLGYVAAGVATPVASVDDVRAFMADPYAPTTEGRMRFLAAHFLQGDAIGRITDVIDAAIGTPVAAPAPAAVASPAGRP